MSCKVEGCNQPIFHNNPLDPDCTLFFHSGRTRKLSRLKDRRRDRISLIRPLLRSFNPEALAPPRIEKKVAIWVLATPLQNFHGMVINLGSELPENGKTAEIVKRIGIAVVAPFAYLALAFVALAGLILNGIWKNRHVWQGNVINQGKASQIPSGTFGKEEWEKTFPVTIGEVPPLPSNIHEILELEDPCEPGKKLKETCLLFFRPKTVMLHEEGADKEITLGFDGVEELASMATNPDRRTKFKTLAKLRSHWNQMPVAEAGWVLMRKEVIPGTRSKNFESQQELLKGGFEVPKLMDAVLLNILYFASEGKHLFGENPKTHTRCQEMYGNDRMIVGCFVPSGLPVFSNVFDNVSIGLAGVWKL